MRENLGVKLEGGHFVVCVASNGDALVFKVFVYLVLYLDRRGGGKEAGLGNRSF